MIKNLKLLLSFRAWLKSRTLNFAGILGAIAAWDLASGSNLIQKIVEIFASTLGWMESTSLAALVALKAVADAVLRAKTDTNLGNK